VVHAGLSPDRNVGGSRVRGAGAAPVSGADSYGLSVTEDANPGASVTPEGPGLA